MEHPNTPDIHNPISKRMFDGQVCLGGGSDMHAHAGRACVLTHRCCRYGPGGERCTTGRIPPASCTSRWAGDLRPVCCCHPVQGLTVCGPQMLLEGALLSPGSCASDRPGSYAAALSGSAPSSRAPSEAGATPRQGRTAATPGSRQATVHWACVHVRQLARVFMTSV